jgi:hypothetical protein
MLHPPKKGERGNGSNPYKKRIRLKELEPLNLIFF